MVVAEAREFVARTLLSACMQRQGPERGGEDENRTNGGGQECPPYIFKKFAIILLPAVVSTLSGWNWTPSMGSWRWRRPMMTRVPSWS